MLTNQHFNHDDILTLSDLNKTWVY